MLSQQLLNVRLTTGQHQNMKFSFKYHTNEEWRVSELDQPCDADDVARKLQTNFFIDYIFYCNVNKKSPGRSDCMNFLSINSQTTTATIQKIIVKTINIWTQVFNRISKYISNQLRFYKEQGSALLINRHEMDYYYLFCLIWWSLIILVRLRVRIMVFNATFNNISVISWQSVLLVEETGVPGENHRPVISH